MLHITQSNSLSVLARRFADSVAMPTAEPLRPIYCVVSQPRLAHWLSLEVVKAYGIAANIQFPLPAGFVWSLIRAVVPDTPTRSVFEPSILRWRLLKEFARFEQRPSLAPLRGYLEHDRLAMGFELATEVAVVFDRYLVDRPDWIREWEAGEGNHWQAALWRSLAESTPGAQSSPHWLQALDTFFAVLERGEHLAIPDSVTFFASGGISASYLDFLERLSRHTDVLIYELNPSEQYWGDIESARRVARRVADNVDDAPYYTVGNRLLASLGRSSQAHIDRLVALDAIWHDAFVAPVEGEPATALQRLQHDIFTLAETVDENRFEPDPSIAIHACHTPMREAEVLHDQLLARFEADPTLNPQDVSVLTPDPAVYLPALEVVFGAATGARRIPFHINQFQSVAANSPAVAFLDLLSLCESRFEATRVLALLGCEAIQRRFDVRPSDLPRLSQWIREVGIRWGGDDAHLSRRGIESGPHSWRAGLDRLILGAIVDTPPGAMLWDIAPRGLALGSDRELLGHLATFVDRLIELAVSWQAPRSVRRWLSDFERAIDSVFSFTLDDADEAQRLRNAFGELRLEVELAEWRDAVPLSLMRRVLSDAIGHGRSSGMAIRPDAVYMGPLVAGGVLPTRLICVLGANDPSFPRREQRVSFDLTSEHPRRGDRSRRDEDRFGFLECALSAGDALYISYLGFDEKALSIKPPSPVVNELWDYLTASYPDIAREAWATHHRLHPFARDYYRDRDSTLFSYAPSFADGLNQAKTHPGPFAAVALPTIETPAVSVDEFVEFFLNPARYYLRHVLHVKPLREAWGPSDDEPFIEEGLDRFRTRELLAEALLRGDQADDEAAVVQRAAQANGLFPLGAIGQAAFAEEHAAASGFITRVQHERLGRVPTEARICVPIGDLRVEGVLEWFSPGGLSLVRTGALRAKDRLELWIRHLLLCASQSDITTSSQYHAWQQTASVAPISDANDHLHTLAALFKRGRETPLPFFPEASWSYIEALGRNHDAARALARASTRFQGSDRLIGEGQSDEVAIVFGSMSPLDERFESMSRHILGPVLTHVADT
ncbi:MAG: exodeoxyribonuclease V subunit gamma [Pseudomonadota bacterium]